MLLPQCLVATKISHPLQLPPALRSSKIGLFHVSSHLSAFLRAPYDTTKSRLLLIPMNVRTLVLRDHLTTDGTEEKWMIN